MLVSCLHELGKTAQAQETSCERAGHAAAGANLLLQHGLLRCASRKCEIGPGPFAHQFKMDPSFRDIAKKDPDLKAIQELI